MHGPIYWGYIIRVLIDVSVGEGMRIFFIIILMTPNAFAFLNSFEYEGVVFMFDAPLKITDCHHEIWVNNITTDWSESQSMKHFVYGYPCEWPVLSKIVNHLKTMFQNPQNYVLYKKDIPLLDSRDFSANLFPNFVLAFVAGFPYNRDSSGDMWNTPIETFARRVGDCDDHAILFSALIGFSCYESVMLRYRTHMAVGVNMQTSGTYLPIDGKKYFLCETSTDGWKCGEKSGSMKDLQRFERIPSFCN